LIGRVKRECHEPLLGQSRRVVTRGLFLDAAAGMADHDGRPLDGEVNIRGVEMAARVRLLLRNATFVRKMMPPGRLFRLPLFRQGRGRHSAAHHDEPHVDTAVNRYERFRCAGMYSVHARSDH
jgi:hypothetical protein